MTAIFHITHIDNLASIVAEGQLHCDAVVSERGLSAVNIGHQDIKVRRLNWPVPCGSGGVVGDYVAFYFAPRSPMLYAIHTGYVAGYDGGQTSVVTLAASAEAVRDAGLSFVFTNGHAAMALTDYSWDLSDLAGIDWEVMKARLWHNTADDPDRKRRRQAEFLVHGTMPWGLIEQIGVRTNAMVNQVEDLLVDASHMPTAVKKPGWYY